MKIIIDHLLGVRHATLNLDGVLEVVGNNASGKTSLAVCAQSAIHAAR